MTGRPDPLPLGRFLQNASDLLEATAKTAQNLQFHLAQFIEHMPDSPRQPPDLIILQSLDLMTQTLADLSTAFRATSRGAMEMPVPEWAEVVKQLKLEYVARALTCGGDRPGAESEVELF
ncbi:hypothetical protein [Paracoccus sp. S1E-3]|uniref:hypothetical protein n=1 Tax=Paracoccus sp. S1E-3 TaxID=2756130 RepID=UPI0015EF27C0|nr:hypothetical protein [Paracoccus sp. S1E-3]MBA4491831.1 hypothetical protein [Paracoccus sp. S1E-3]